VFSFSVSFTLNGYAQRIPTEYARIKIFYRSVSVAKIRAAKAAGILMKAAKDADAPVLLMGHGIINRYIAKELLASGWKEQTRPVPVTGVRVFTAVNPRKSLFFH
jgi:hypothetical protein